MFIVIDSSFVKFRDRYIFIEKAKLPDACRLASQCYLCCIACLSEAVVVFGSRYTYHRGTLLFYYSAMIKSALYNFKLQ